MGIFVRHSCVSCGFIWDFATNRGDCWNYAPWIDCVKTRWWWISRYLERNVRRRTRRTFTDEFRADVVRLCRQGDCIIAQIARELYLTNGSVRQRVKQAEADANPQPTGPLTTETSSLQSYFWRLWRRNTRRVGLCAEPRDSISSSDTDTNGVPTCVFPGPLVDNDRVVSAA